VIKIKRKEGRVNVWRVGFGVHFDRIMEFLKGFKEFRFD
jgi:hypothetical protein